ncbi:MAG: hypothetical protein ACK40O_00980 [Allosphingosinicella sp.]
MGGLPPHVSDAIAGHLDAIGAYFKDPKITLLVRNEVGVGLDGDLVMTNDQLPLAIAGLQHRLRMDAGADAAALVVDLGVGKFQIGGHPDEQPPRIHFYRDEHDQPIGSDVPLEKKSPERVLTLVFHNEHACGAMAEALWRSSTWFPPEHQEPAPAKTTPEPPKSGYSDFGVE